MTQRGKQSVLIYKKKLNNELQFVYEYDGGENIYQQSGTYLKIIILV